MTDFKRLPLNALFPVLLTLMIACTGRGHSYKIDVFKSGNGYGYDILINNKPYIHQPYMPAVEGMIPFSSRHAARTVGYLVVKKLKNHESPTITKKELELILKK